MMLIRQFLAIAVLPFTMIVLIPLWIACTYATPFSFTNRPPHAALMAAGIILVAVGLFLFISSLYEFATRGQGTLAPWDPPKNLVLRGPYRYVRNPMISGVIIILFGEAAVLYSQPHAIWALTFLLINAIYIPLLEEPQLARRFGADYDEYRRHVHIIVPRLRPWTPAPKAE